MGYFRHYRHHDGKHDCMAVGQATTPAGMDGQTDTEHSPCVPPHPIPPGTALAQCCRKLPVPPSSLGATSCSRHCWCCGGAGDEGGGVPCQRHGCGAGAWQQLLAAPLFSWPWCSCLSPPSLPPALGESAQCWPCSQHSYLAAAGGSARGAQCRVPVSPPLQSCLMGVGTVPGPSTAVACADPQPRAHL